MAVDRKFTGPHEVADIPGTEGWREMYPYYYLFSKDNAERVKYESSQLWFYDGLHYPEPMYPFDLFWDDCWHAALSVHSSRILCVPPALGIDHRIVNGYVYITPVVAKPEDIPARAILFEKRAGYYYENWDSIWADWKVKFKKLIDELKTIHFSPLPDVEDEAVVFERRGYSTADVVLREYNRLIELGQRAWQYHFEMLGLAYAADVVYIDAMRKLFPAITDKAIGQTTMGFEAEMFIPPMELQKLAQSAVEMGLDDIILVFNKWEEMSAKLQQDKVGQKWLERVNMVREPWFEMTIGTGWYHTDVAWNDNLDFPLSQIKNYILALKRGAKILRPSEEVIKVRDRVTAEYRNLIKSEADREIFDTRLGMTRKVASYPEGHQFYVENWFHVIFWRKVRELGRLMEASGALKDSEDIWYLSRFEIYPVLYDICAAWSTGVPPVAQYEIPPKIDGRKKIYARFKEWRPPPALGPAPDTISEPFTIVLWGITTPKIDSWLEAKEVKRENVKELKGMPGSAGIAEGIARVCFTPDDISNLKAGEILVAPTTSSSWAPVFQIIKGSVTDVGGTFCHAAIVSREYNLPSVMGVGIGTQIIKTGDRIKVDGDNGIVTILEKVK